MNLKSTPGGDGGEALLTDANGNIYLTGDTWGSLGGNTSAGGDDAYLIKFDSSGMKQ